MAVLLVALNHAGVPGLPGGFVGVDVFYVVSGFVITQSLLRGRHGSWLSLSDFYAARARRILPMSTLVLVVTVLTSWVVFDAQRAQTVVVDALWAGLFGANFRFASTGTDYFASGLPQSPLQHYWSLAVEEQFYVIWPLLLGVVVLGITRERRRRAVSRGSALRRVARRRLLLVLGVIIVASLTWSVRQTAHSPTVAFFSTATRSWELAIGAALAVGSASVARLPTHLRKQLGWAGLLGVGASAVLIKATTPFPGWAALMPVLGTAAVIAAGTGVQGPGNVTRLLRLPAFQRLGDASFSFYLWHWPILIIASGYAKGNLPMVVRLGLLVAALALSRLTFRFVETPFRTSEWLTGTKRRSLSLWPAVVSVLAVTCLLVSQSISAAEAAKFAAFNDRHSGPSTDLTWVRSAADLTSAVAASAVAARAKSPLPAGLIPRIDRLVGDWDAGAGCVSRTGNTSGLCSYGDLTARRTLVLAGDSHALQWLPAFDALGKRLGYKIVLLVKFSCFSADLAYGSGAQQAECRVWQKWMFDTVGKIHPARVVISNHLQSNNPAAWRAGIASTVRKLTRPGTRVTVFSDTPVLGVDPEGCLLRDTATMSTCALHYDAASDKLQRAVKAGAADTSAEYLDVTPWFCAAKLCPVVLGSVIAYRDYGHISGTYALLAAGALGKKLHL